MEHISKAANQAQQAVRTRQSNDKPQSSPEHRKAMLVMWTAMAHAFGSSWVSQYGTSEESSFRSWSKALSQYTPEQIRRGVRNSVNPDMWQGSFPPNLAEFSKLCLTKLFTHPSHKPFEIEHKPKRASRNVVQRELAKMRKIVYGDKP